MVLTTAVFVGAQTDQIQVILDGEILVFEQPPIIENSRTLVPLRVIFEALGADVGWAQSTRTATATKDDTVITVQIDNPVMTKDGENFTLDAPPRLVNSQTLVPVRAVAEAFGAYVDWDNSNRTVIIETNNPFLFLPNPITKPANEMADTELIGLLEKLVNNADDLVGGWFLSGNGLELDEQSIFVGGNPNARYVEVKNIKDMASLKANLEIVFSHRFLEDLVFPFIFDKELPLFIEQGGKLYFDDSRGSGGGPPSDFTRAKVISKGTNTFEIEVPLTAITDEEKLFIYKAVQQNGNWVLDSYWWIIG